MSNLFKGESKKQAYVQTRTVDMNVQVEGKIGSFHSERGKTVESLTNRIYMSINMNYFTLFLVIYN